MLSTVSVWTVPLPTAPPQTMTEMGSCRLLESPSVCRFVTGLFHSIQCLSESASLVGRAVVDQATTVHLSFRPWEPPL